MKRVHEKNQVGASVEVFDHEFLQTDVSDVSLLNRCARGTKECPLLLEFSNITGAQTSELSIPNSPCLAGIAFGVNWAERKAASISRVFLVASSCSVFIIVGHSVS